MADTFDADPETLPPVTKAFRLAWVKANPETGDRSHRPTSYAQPSTRCIH